MNSLLVKNIANSLEEEFELHAFGYYDVKELESFSITLENNVVISVFNGKPRFFTEQLMKDIAPQDISNLASKLEPPQQNINYMALPKEIKGQYKNFLTQKFDLETPRDSVESLISHMNNPTFIFFFLKKI